MKGAAFLLVAARHQNLRLQFLRAVLHAGPVPLVVLLQLAQLGVRVHRHLYTAVATVLGLLTLGSRLLQQ